MVGNGTKRWWTCRHQKSCKNCGRILEWSLRDNKECPDWQHYNAFAQHYKGLFAKDLDNLPIEE